MRQQIVSTIKSNLSISSYGDSYTYGSGATSTDKRYAKLIAKSYGLAENMQGVSGSYCADVQDKLFLKSIKDNDVSTILVGINDIRFNGLDSTHLGYYTEAMRACILWATRESADTIKAQSSNVVYTGSWSNGTAYGNNVAKISTSDGATATFTVTGSIVYLAYFKFKTGGGSFNVTIDGVNKGNYSCAGSDTTYLGNNNHTGYVRFAGLEYAEHTVVLTTIGTNNVAWCFAASNQAPTYNKPLVIIMKINYLTENGWALAPGIIGSNNAVDAYNQELAIIVSEMASDGMRVHLCDNPLYDNSGYYAVDELHPNDVGHQLIAKSFISL